MDIFETARLDAELLHRELEVKGVNVCDPLIIVTAAIEYLDLEVYWLESGDPQLKGAQAIYDPHASIICADDAIPNHDRPLLLAHEIGHARLHVDASGCSENEVDVSASSEASPIGVKRVTDYGAKERRELQANVFARELLIPRYYVRKLYIDNQKTSVEISELLNLPLVLVKQQLLDALLVTPDAEPEILTKSPTSKSLKKDESQQRAANHRDAPFQLQAGPGTGKTRTLVTRIKGLLEENVDPASILVLTFSNSTALELTERISSTVPMVASKIWVGTFHAFGLDLIRRYHDRLDLPSDPRLFDRSDAIAILEEILPTLPLIHYKNLWDPALILKEILSAISRAKDELVNPIKYKKLAEEMLVNANDDDSRVTAEKCLEVAEVYAIYERILFEREAIDFGDLVMRPALLLDNDQEVRSTIQFRHRHILVDEYQDVNRASVRLLQGIVGDGKRLWVVGDSRQSIYRFRGASSFNMTRFSSDFPDGVNDQLEINYRSKKEIVDLYTEFSHGMSASKGALPLKLKSNRGSGIETPQIRRYTNPKDELGGIAASIKELEAQGVSLRDQAVLCRTNSKLTDVAQALEARGIAVLHLGSLFERDEIRDLLSLLSLACDRFGGGLLRVCLMPRYSFSLQDAYFLKELFGGESDPPLSDITRLKSCTNLSTEGHESVLRLIEDLEEFNPSIKPWDLLTTYLLDRTRELVDLSTSTSIEKRMTGIAIWQFLNFVREYAGSHSGSPIYKVLERVRHLVLLNEDRDLRQVPAAMLNINAVRLMTVHGSKGLEFEAVHIPGMTVSSFPASNKGNKCPPPDGLIVNTEVFTGKEESKFAFLAEEECLFFVAVSRARSYLCLYLSKTQKNGGNRNPSPYLSRILSHIKECEAPAVISFNVPSNLVNVTWPNEWGFTQTHVLSYEKCPRKFFYTHALNIGGARKHTPFTQTHNCLYKLIDLISSGDPSERTNEKYIWELFNNIWAEKGPVDHAYTDDYQKIAKTCTSHFISSAGGSIPQKNETFIVDLGSGSISITPDEIAALDNGTVIFRRIRTGKRKEKEEDDLMYSLYKIAGDIHYPGRYQIEAIHLTEGSNGPVTISAKKFTNRQKIIANMLTKVSDNHFPTSPDPVSCPRCQHFFICGARLNGTLHLSTK